jgi:predicted heme/steroid binding protein
MAAVLLLMVCTAAVDVDVDDSDSDSAAAAVEQRDYTPEDLQLYNGDNPARPLLLSFKGVVFDVSESPHFYGPGSNYAAMTGNEIGTLPSKNPTITLRC